MAEKKGFDLAAVLGDVSKLDTGAAPGRKQLEYLELERLDPDPRNFYALDGIEELAANIELLGLQQPLTVRESEETPGRYVVVSGHRRREALLRLAKDDPEKWRYVPCIREKGGSPALQELRLIYANMDTRKMSSADISRQAERVEALLYELKEQGMEFPGRMRDHVAEACKVSKTKLARLKVIREKLIPELKKAWEKAELNEAVAYALAQQPEAMQRDIVGHIDVPLQSLMEWRVNDFAEKIREVDMRVCRRGTMKGLPCVNREKMLDRICLDRYRWNSAPCPNRKCCTDCIELLTCPYSCPMLAELVKKKKAEAKAQKQMEKHEKANEDELAIREIERLWFRWGQAMDRAGLTDEQLKEKLGLPPGAFVYSWQVKKEQVEPLKDGSCTDTKPDTGTPLYPFLTRFDMHSLIARADALGCSLDYLLCRTDVPEVNTGAAAPDRWQTGTPKEGGLYAARFDCGGAVIRNIAKYDTGDGSWRFLGTYARIDAECIAWVKLPEEDDGKGEGHE